MFAVLRVTPIIVCWAADVGEASRRCDCSSTRVCRGEPCVEVLVAASKPVHSNRLACPLSTFGLHTYSLFSHFWTAYSLYNTFFYKAGVVLAVGAVLAGRFCLRYGCTPTLFRLRFGLHTLRTVPVSPERVL